MDNNIIDTKTFLKSSTDPDDQLFIKTTAPQTIALI